MSITTMTDEDRTEQAPATVRRETFIPVSRLALIDRLRAEEKKEADDFDPGSTTELFRYLSVWRHQTYQQRLARLKECYLPFSPDRDTKRILEYSNGHLDELKTGLIKHITTLLEQANYNEIAKDDLENYLQSNSAHGLELNVDLSEFDEVLIFSRGYEVETIHRRVIDNLYLFKREFKVPIYKRLFLLLKLKSIDTRVKEIMAAEDVSEKKARRINKKQRKGLPDDPNGSYVYLKLFKNIPQEDLEMMFPNTQVKLKLFDKVKLGVTAGGGTAAGIAGAATKVMAAIAAANPIGLAAALFGVVGLIFRQIMNVFNTRTKYMMRLAQRLFFHSLANNRGVITLLVDRAEEEDIKEEMLLYFFLLRHPMPRSELREGGKLDVYIEAFLTREFDVTVDFDLVDALKRLVADGLLVETKDGMITTRSPEQACKLLEHKWRTFISAPQTPQKDENYEAED